MEEPVMTSKMLQKARDFEKKYLPYTVSDLPEFHVTGGIGWINDPNGFAPTIWTLCKRRS